MNADIFKIRENKNKIQALSLVAIFAISILMAFAQPSAAQIGVPQPEKTVGYISVAPTLIGLGQAPTVNLWVFPLPTNYIYGPTTNGFYGVTVTFVRPDGTKDTFMPTDATGSLAAGQMQSLGALFFTHYVPNMVGNWSVSFTMPAQNITTSAGTVQYLGCTSNSYSFTVQNGIVLAGLLNGYPWAELPNSNVYWSYPINDNNREWSQISGDWTGITNTFPVVNSPTQQRWQPYGTGPNTAHIVWKQQLKEGGIIGGQYGGLSYTGGIVNTPPNIGVVVMDGMEYVNIPNTTPAGQFVGQFRCIDLSTGQVLYTANGTITNGIHLPGNTYQQSNLATQGEANVVLAASSGSLEFPYLFGTVTTSDGTIYWNYYDALTGVLLRTINNCSAARLIDGTVIGFGAQQQTITPNAPIKTGNSAIDGYVYRWNMTSVVGNNWITGITWKTHLPVSILKGSLSLVAPPAIFAVSSDLSVIVVKTINEYWAYDGTTGASLWNMTLNYPATSNEEIPLAGVDDFFVFDATAATFKFYSIKTGAFLFETPSFASSPWATTYTVYFSETNDLNNVYFAFPDGAVRAYSLTDGHLLWTSTPILSTEYTANALPFATPGMVMVDGKIYVYGGYTLYYEIDPVPRLSEMICINATTGDTLYTLNGGVWPAAAANGYVIGYGNFDGKMYCLGKGPTSTTATAQQQVGGSVLIQGSVIDTSPVSSSATLTAMYHNGVPAISDANMSVWMDYLHMQNSTLLNTPPACNGVPVSLDALDPNGNFIHIGDVTSSGSGVFKYQWTPTTAGLYSVYATFGGSESYFSSFAETSATVATAAATTTPAPTQTHAPSNLATTTDLMTYIVVVGIAMIIAIAIATVLILRKK